MHERSTFWNWKHKMSTFFNFTHKKSVVHMHFVISRMKRVISDTKTLHILEFCAQEVYIFKFHTQNWIFTYKRAPKRAYNKLFLQKLCYTLFQKVYYTLKHSGRGRLPPCIRQCVYLIFHWLDVKGTNIYHKCTTSMITFIVHMWFSVVPIWYIFLCVIVTRMLGVVVTIYMIIILATYKEQDWV